MRSEARSRFPHWQAKRIVIFACSTLKNTCGPGARYGCLAASATQTTEMRAFQQALQFTTNGPAVCNLHRCYNSNSRGRLSCRKMLYKRVVVS
jgi:hypothetical protein